MSATNTLEKAPVVPNCDARVFESREDASVFSPRKVTEDNLLDLNSKVSSIPSDTTDNMDPSLPMMTLPLAGQQTCCWGELDVDSTVEATVGNWENVKHLKDSYAESPDICSGSSVCETRSCDHLKTDIEKQIHCLAMEDDGAVAGSSVHYIGGSRSCPFLCDNDLKQREEEMRRMSPRCSHENNTPDFSALGDLQFKESNPKCLKTALLEKECSEQNLGGVGESDVSIDSLFESSHLLQEHVILLDLNKDLSSVDADDDSSSSNVSCGKQIHVPNIDSKKERALPKLIDSKSQSARAKMIPRRRNSNDDNEWKYVSSPNNHDHEMRTVENIAGSPKVSTHCSLCEGLELEKNDIPPNCDVNVNGAQSNGILNSCTFASLSSLVSANTDSANSYTREMLRKAALLEAMDDDQFLDLSFYKPVVPLDNPILYNTYDSSCSISLGDLPIELVQKILSYFTPQTLCQSVAPVCKRWYQLAYDPVLWKQLIFNDNVQSITSFTLCRVISRAPYLRHLSLPGRTKLTIAEVATFSQYCTHLRSLDLGFCHSVNFNILELIVLNCQLLEELNLEGCSQIDHKCIKLLVNLSKMKQLNLSHCTLLSDESIILIASTLRCLHSLNIDGISWIYDESVRHLVHHQKSSLLALELDGAELTNASFESLSECSKLAKISVSFAELLTDTTLQYLLKLKGLRHLRLRKGSEFTTHGLKSLFETDVLKNLTLLDLTECTFLDDAGVLALAQCCGKSLSHLALGWCWNITDIGLISIVDHCSNLSYLDLLGLDKITGVCLDRIIEEMPKLRFLDLSNCNRIMDDLIVEVVRQKPDLVVINYYGEQFSASEPSTNNYF